MGASTRLSYRRGKFRFPRPNGPQEKGTTPTQDTFSHYGLLNDFSDNYYSKSIVERLPKGVVLSDYHAYALLSGGVADSKRGEAFPADFTNHATILPSRQHRGRAANFQDKTGRWQYQTAGRYIFYGDEGASARFLKVIEYSLVSSRLACLCLVPASDLSDQAAGKSRR